MPSAGGQIKAGATNDEMWAFWDFLPTAEIAGVKPPKDIDGIASAGRCSEKADQPL